MILTGKIQLIIGFILLILGTFLAKYQGMGLNISQRGHAFEITGSGIGADLVLILAMVFLIIGFGLTMTSKRTRH
ncbi:MAG: hypothetical protein DUD35_00230 [Lactobacillus sp.]|jgi:preprotein translocase subunit SecG|nr:hypothetical protein HMPREF0496_1746 [Lentilactobacillus hilgardii ATCC 27305]MCT3391347.1 hypothetical protein [Lentilactobacillus hilgardii]RRG12484.1 MAG: hypothetical protein DUD35_00230 [Lactobacillus sp.]